ARIGNKLAGEMLLEEFGRQDAVSPVLAQEGGRGRAPQATRQIIADHEAMMIAGFDKRIVDVDLQTALAGCRRQQGGRALAWIVDVWLISRSENRQLFAWGQGASG